MSEDFIRTATTTALWIDQLGDIERRPALGGDIDVDVAIVGGGFSGLWTAYYLSQLAPTARIAVIEKHYCGYGASGRNGGWAEGGLAVGPEKYSQWSSMSAAMRLVDAMHDSVDEIGRVATAENIACGYKKGGWIRLARNGAQARRMKEEMSEPGAHGQLLDPEAARSYMNATDVHAGIYSPDCAALNPAQLVRGLADACERNGVAIYEDTAAASVDKKTVRTNKGTVRADVVVQATEAYTRCPTNYSSRSAWPTGRHSPTIGTWSSTVSAPKITVSPLAAAACLTSSARRSAPTPKPTPTPTPLYARPSSKCCPSSKV